MLMFNELSQAQVLDFIFSLNKHISFWPLLKGKKYRFSKQYDLLRYILPFFTYATKVIVEKTHGEEVFDHSQLLCCVLLKRVIFNKFDNI